MCFNYTGLVFWIHSTFPVLAFAKLPERDQSSARSHCKVRIKESKDSQLTDFSAFWVTLDMPFLPSHQVKDPSHFHMGLNPTRFDTNEEGKTFFISNLITTEQTSYRFVITAKVNKGLCRKLALRKV